MLTPSQQAEEEVQEKSQARLKIVRRLAMDSVWQAFVSQQLLALVWPGCHSYLPALSLLASPLKTSSARPQLYTPTQWKPCPCLGF